MDFDEEAYEKEERQETYNDNVIRVDKEYFIDQYGKIRKFKGDLYEEYISYHYEIANQEFPNMKIPDDYVYKCLNWVMIGSTVYSTPILENKPNQAQINTLYKLGLLDRLCVSYEGYKVNYLKYRIRSMEKKYDNIKLAILNITSWCGQCADAEHVYGHLILCNSDKITIETVEEWGVSSMGESIELRRPLTLELAKVLDKKCGGHSNQRAFRLVTEEPEFIIETDDELGDCLILSKCTFHKDLAIDKEKVKGGGMFNYNSKNNTFTFSGESHDFGKASLEDIQKAVLEDKVFTNPYLTRSIAKKHKFLYDTGSELIPLN